MLISKSIVIFCAFGIISCKKYLRIKTTDVTFSEEIKSSSKISCGGLCDSKLECQGFKYNKTSRNCEIVEKYILEEGQIGTEIYVDTASGPFKGKLQKVTIRHI